MGRAQKIVEQASERRPRSEPPAEAMQSGVRQTQADGSITILDRDWKPSPDRRPERPRVTPVVVDRSPTRVFD
jgi:hypothetical protein